MNYEFKYGEPVEPEITEANIDEEIHRIVEAQARLREALDFRKSGEDASMLGKISEARELSKSTPVTEYISKENDFMRR